jgi:hypothetical protein
MVRCRKGKVGESLHFHFEHRDLFAIVIDRVFGQNKKSASAAGNEKSLIQLLCISKQFFTRKKPLV